MASNRQIHKDQIVEFMNRFYRTAWDWRSQAYHANWDTYERNFHNIYDPTIKSKKENWQATMFIPVSVTNVEVIFASLVKVLAGGDRLVSLRPREMGDELQSELWTKRLDYEVEEAHAVIGFADVLKEALIYGSGFAKVYWQKIFEQRRHKIKSISNFNRVADMTEVEEIRDVLVRNSAVVEKIHIRDIFIEPNALTLDRILHRSRVTYAELFDMAKKGFVDKDSVEKLRDITESDKFDIDQGTVQYERGITDPDVPRPAFDKRHTVWEFWGMVPRKWIDLDMDDNSDVANELLPGKLMTASGKWFLASEKNPFEDMKPPFLKMDYIRTGETYGKGVCQLIAGLQEEINELRNQRVDNVSLVLNKMVAIVEKAIVDTNELISRPGGAIRLRGNLDNADVKKYVQFIDPGDVALSGYKETFELERQIQEVTAANRVTTGTAGLVRDANQTLGGMELLKQAAFDRFTVYAWMIGKTFLVDLAKKLLSLSYQNRTSDENKRILGMQPVEILPGQIVAKHMALIEKTPEEIENDYDFIPVDIFGQENKRSKVNDLMNLSQLTAQTLPRWNPRPALEMAYRLMGFSAEEIYAILGEDTGPLDSSILQGLGLPSLPKPTRETSRAQMPEAGLAVQ